uniref:Rab-GAP TBC domain-containing protein n=1 Tax=Chlamydomonas leiostraca TaxID=1034604 RepID=A0A7S0RDZ9_9CHLO
MIRKGVAPTCRTWMWMNTSTAAKKKAAMASNYFQIMVTAGASVPCMPDIEQDISHTFSTHPWISSPDGQAALKRVLSAYAAHNDKVGYCRSMNNIVALLLVAMNRNEENAFWLLASLVEDILYPGTYSNKLEGCQVEMRALDELLGHKLPRLHAHFVAKDCDISLIATDWYLSMFTTSLPSETVARVWDALFNEGPKILFRVALALLKQHEEHLLHCDNAGDIVMTMRAAAASTHHHDKLMAMAFDGLGSLPMATIDKFRDMKAREVEAASRGEGSGSAGATPEAAAVAGVARTGSERAGGGSTAADKAKAGFGKLMTGLNKWGQKTADKMAQAAEKIGIKDDEPLPGQGGPPQQPRQ